MKKKNDPSFFSNLKHRFRLIVMNDSSLEEQISIRFTGVQLTTAISIAAILLFVFFLLLVGYTPLSEYVPGKASSRLHKELIEITLKTDSLEKALLENELYLKNISAIVSGEDPVSLSGEIESPSNISETDLSFRRSKEDSLLRMEVESEDKLSLSPSDEDKDEGLENILFLAP